MSTLLSSLIAHGEQSLSASATALLLKVTALLLVTWCVHWLLRPLNPRWRLLLWRSTSVGILALPLFSFCPPLTSWAVFPAKSTAAGRIEPVSQSSLESVPLETLGRSDIWDDDTNVSEPFSVPHGEVIPTASVPAGTAIENQTASSMADPPMPSSRQRGSFPTIDPPQVLVSAWLIGIGAGLLWTLVCLARIQAIVRRAAPVPEWLETEATAVSQKLGCRLGFCIRQSDEVATPCLVGIHKVVILLPVAQCNGDRRDEVTAILAHEIAHVMGRDLQWNLALHLMSVVLWFHPLMWRIRSTHANTCDAVADAVAADHIGDPNFYGRTLARLAVRVRQPAVAASLGMARISNIRRRIDNLQRKVFWERLPRRRAATFILFGIVNIVIIGGVALTQAQGEPPKLSGNTTGSSSATQAESSSSPKGVDKTDNNQKSRLTVFTVDEKTGIAMPDVAVRFHGRIAGKIYNREQKTDNKGATSIEWDKGSVIEHLWMTCRKDGYVPIHHTWRDGQVAIELPENLRLRFQQGVKIGGIVEDQQGKPIADAKVDISMRTSWPKLANYSFTAATLNTNDLGQWTWDGAPFELGSLSIRVTHPDYLREWAKGSTNAQIVTVLKQGEQLNGRVVDGNGTPVKGARVLEGLSSWSETGPVSTDDNGHFVLRNRERGPSAVTVQADGFQPAVQSVTIADSNEPLEFRLEPGKTLKVRVVDSEGQPIKDAIVAPESWRGYDTVNNRMTSDQNGRVSWENAPADVVIYSILKKGFMSRRDYPITVSEEEHTVTLLPRLIISGSVKDVATGRPISSSFNIRVGHDVVGRDTYWRDEVGASFEGGQYRYEFDEPIRGGYLLQVLAPGFDPSTSRPFNPEEGSITYDFALRSSKNIAGRILTPSGDPAVDAEVRLATVDTRISFDNGYFRRREIGDKVLTDDNGAFSFPPRGDEPYLIVCVHDTGFAEVKHEQIQSSQEIRLDAWGRIEGKVKLGNEPDRACQVFFSPRRPARIGPFVFSYGYEGQTDNGGNFVFDRVIPGPGTVSRVVVTHFGGSQQHSPGWHQSIVIEPKTTTQVTIGGTGRVISGVVGLEREVEVPHDWTTNEPASIERWDRVKNIRDDNYFRCLGNIDKSGRFIIPDVPPGDYKLRVPVNNPPTPNSCGPGNKIGLLEHQFTVSPTPSERTNEPLDLGMFKAQLFDTLDVGELAPDFVARKLPDGQVRLSELTGKLVLLDFWATWCKPCIAEMPTLKSIYNEFGKDERFVLLSVSCDDAMDAPRDYVKNNDLPWSHAHIPGMNSRTIADYTVRSIPATFLIGPDGRVLAKNLRGDELKHAVSAALKDVRLFQSTAINKRPPRFPFVHFDVSPKDRLMTLPRLVVLDDCDPDFDKAMPRDDSVRLISAEGKLLRKEGGFNNCEYIGGAHMLAIDSQREKFFVCENVGDRVLCFDLHGRKLWQVEGIKADILTVDPQTGNLWCSGGSSLKNGETIVLDGNGQELMAFPFRGVDIVYDPHSDSFWLVGYKILKLSRQGKVLFEQPVKGWCCASVSINRSNGDVWFIERDHPDVAKSANRLWKLDEEGKVLIEEDLGDDNLFAIEFDPQTGGVWVATLNKGLLRFGPTGELMGKLDHKVSNLAMDHDGVWAATEKAVIKIDRNGNVVTQYDFERPSHQSWLAVSPSSEQ